MVDTKFQHNADILLEMIRKTIGKPPKHFITDGLLAYMKSPRKVFDKNIIHSKSIHLRRGTNNKRWKS